MNPKAKRFLKKVSKEMLDGALVEAGYDDLSLLYAIAAGEANAPDLCMSDAEEAQGVLGHYREKLALEMYYNAP